MNKPNKKYLQLADKLEALTPFNEKFNVIIRRCRDQQYHDFLTDLATPKMQMITDLQAAGLEDEVILVKEGYYDE